MRVLNVQLYYVYAHFQSFRAKNASALSCTCTAAGKSLPHIRRSPLFQSCYAAIAIHSCFVFRRARLAALCCGCNNYSLSEGGQAPALHAGVQLSCSTSAASLRHSAPHLWAQSSRIPAAAATLKCSSAANMATGCRLSILRAVPSQLPAPACKHSAAVTQSHRKVCHVYGYILIINRLQSVFP